MSELPSTADYRKYPKGPNFKLIVILASIFLVIGLVAAYFVVESRGKKMIPHGPNPEPNSLVQPADGRTGKLTTWA